MTLSAVQVTPAIENYMESLLRPRSGALQRAEREAKEQAIPAVGPAVGQLLALLAAIRGCRSILELGTAGGYSALWLLTGARNARFVGLELDPRRAEAARRHLAEGGFEQAEVVQQEAVEYLRRDRTTYDLVFNDLLNSFPSVEVTRQAYELVVPRLAPGGLLITDNALRRGEVVRPASPGAHNVRLWNQLISADERFDSVLLPLRDGVLVARLRHG